MSADKSRPTHHADQDAANCAVAPAGAPDTPGHSPGVDTRIDAGRAFRAVPGRVPQGREWERDWVTAERVWKRERRWEKDPGTVHAQRKRAHNALRFKVKFFGGEHAQEKTSATAPRSCSLHPWFVQLDRSPVPSARIRPRINTCGKTSLFRSHRR